MDTCINNDHWAYHIVDQLVSQKVFDFCIAPGSRSSPITLAVAQRKDINAFVHFDERGLAFYALGIAKAKKCPVSIVVTSGTALGNLLPAIMEAYQSHIPLIVITADRPMELKDCMANQTIEQTRLFQNFVKWQCEIAPSSDVSTNYIRSVVSYGVFESMQNCKGPIHINCSFREPLYSNPLIEQISIPTTNYSSLNCAFDTSLAKQVHKKIYAHQKGLILVGNIDLGSVDAIISISKLLKWPIYIEVLSRINLSKISDTLLFQLPYLLEFFPNQFDDIDCVLQFGDRIISKKVLNWLKNTQLKDYFLVTEHSRKSDELQLISERIITLVKPFVEQFSGLDVKKENSNLSEVKALDCMLNAKIIEQIMLFEHLSEHHIYHFLSDLKFTDHCVFFGNSSVVRDANTLFFPHMMQSRIYANRGTSGIDGNTATIAGISAATKLSTIAVIGDLTFLHDLTSLYFFKSLRRPVTLFVINNDGGEIFSQLPVVKFHMHFEKFFKTPHGLNFSKIAEFFSIQYRCIGSISELKTYIGTSAFQSSQIIELKICASNCHILRKKIKSTLKEAACSHLKQMAAQRIAR